LNAKISLDPSYDSGVPGWPGARFVVHLNTSVIQLDPNASASAKLPKKESNSTIITKSDESSIPSTITATRELPKELSVLFVDDDIILRKLFCRMVHKVAPGWTVREAANGETSLKLVEEHQFQVIFMDMYMASVEKQLLGTEAVMALRSKGVDCKICGLSANDVKQQFLAAGADSFMTKPFPCEPEALKAELLSILYPES